jgi:phenylacetate-CoA ligase
MIASVPVGLRMGEPFFYWYSLFLTSEEWSSEKVDSYQRKLLTNLLSEVSQKNPYYKALLAGISPVEAANNLSLHVPVMTRTEYRNEYGRIRSSNFQGKLTSASTSGTSGNALQFFHAHPDNFREWAAICHQWRRVGYDPLRSIRAEFRGLVAGSEIVQRFPESRMIRCSILHLKTDHVRHYAKICANEGVQFIHGYPSAIFLLAQEMLSSGVRFSGIRGLMLASEMVYPHHLQSIREAFPEAKVTSHYGNAERVALGAWCENNESYHLLPLYSQVGVDPLDGALIGTNLFNTVNPFIRYRMSDIVTGAINKSCPSCGRYAAPLCSHIQGRSEDYLYSPQRGWIPPAIVTYPLKSLQKVHEIQFYQKERDCIELRYTSRHDGDCMDEINAIRQGLREILGDIQVTPIRHDSFERGSTGKFKWIVSELAREGDGVGQ